MRRLILGVLVALVVGCATEEGLRKRLDPTIGMDEPALITYAQRPPTSSHDTEPVNGKKVRFLSWAVVGADTMPGYWQCIRGVCFVQPPTTYNYYCNLIFRLEEGIVQSYQYSGNACRA